MPTYIRTKWYFSSRMVCSLIKLLMKSNFSLSSSPLSMILIISLIRFVWVLNYFISILMCSYFVMICWIWVNYWWGMVWVIWTSWGWGWGWGWGWIKWTLEGTWCWCWCWCWCWYVICWGGWIKAGVGLLTGILGAYGLESGDGLGFLLWIVTWADL